MEERDSSQSTSYSEKYVYAMMRRFRPPKRLASRAAKLMKYYAKKSSNSYFVNTTNANNMQQNWELGTIPEIPRTRGFNSRRVFLRRKKELSECNDKENIQNSKSINNETNTSTSGVKKSKNCTSDNVQIINAHIPCIPRHVSQEHKRCHVQCMVQPASKQSTSTQPFTSDCKSTPSSATTQHALKRLIKNETSKDQIVMLEKPKKWKRQSCQAPHSFLQSIRVFTPTLSVNSQETNVVGHGKYTKSMTNIMKATSHANEMSPINNERIREKEHNKRDKHIFDVPLIPKNQLTFEQRHPKHHVNKCFSVKTGTVITDANVNVFSNNKANGKHQFHSHILAPEQLYDKHQENCTSPSIDLKKDEEEEEELCQSSNSHEINDSYNNEMCSTISSSTHSECKILVSEEVEHNEWIRKKNEKLSSQTQWEQQEEELESNESDIDEDALTFEITEMYDPRIALEDAENEMQASKDDSGWFSTPEKTFSELERAKPPRWVTRRPIMSPRQILYEKIVRFNV